MLDAESNTAVYLREMDVFEGQRTLELNWAQSFLGKRVNLWDAGDDTHYNIGSTPAGSK